MDKNKKLIMIFIFLLCVILICVGIIFIFHSNNAQVCFEKKCFKVEIAADDVSRQQGLMLREKLDKDKGMIFVFDEEGTHSFWMKNTLIPLDMIWINENNGEFRVVDIKTAEPCVTEKCDVYTPGGKSRFVLEINSGLTEKFDIKVGDLVYLDNIVK